MFKRENHRSLSKSKDSSKHGQDGVKRRLFLENLEDRRLLAVGPQLIGVQDNDGSPLRFDNPTQTRNIAPRELTFRFDENQTFSDEKIIKLMQNNKKLLEKKIL